MFYSETLLSKTGPLARVWLSANLERKLSKTHILQSNIESSVNAIVDQGTAPMALRLSGQLLLGVVRIYSRKARYLLDDCNEALLKIKMAFRPGNVDLPADLTAPAAGALTLADKISDPLMPDFDPSLLDLRPSHAERASQKDDPLIWNSQVLTEPSIELGRDEPIRTDRVEYDDDDVNVDLDLDLGGDEGMSIEVGRNAGATMPLNDDLMGTDLFTKDVNVGGGGETRLSSEVPSLIEDRDDATGGMMLDGDDELALPSNLDDAAPAAAPAQAERVSQSPLSSVPSEDLFERDSTRLMDAEEQEASIQKATHKAKKRKVLPNDSVTMLTSDIIKKQQADRSAILKPASFLPRDPVLLNLMNLQRKGAFMSSILGHGPIKGLAPELRGILSIEVIRKSSQLKRKRDVDDEDGDDAVDGEPSRVRFDLSGDDNNLDFNDDVDAGAALPGGETMIDLPGADDPLAQQADADEEEELEEAYPEHFDETTAPLLHPMEQGAISQGTKHAVHLLRDRFGSSSEGTPSSQKKANISFQELLPERSTTKADATKMFFETLVLATKDAIKVEQGDKEVGSNIRIRAKRGLWGAWAEEKAGGEIAEQESAAEVVAAA